MDGMAIARVASGSVAVAVVAAVTFACVLKRFRPRFIVNMEDDQDVRANVLARRVNMDFAPIRRRIRDAFSHIQHSLDHPLFKMPEDEITIEERYEFNSRGLEIFSRRWLPRSIPTKGIVCYCHGYGDTCTFFFEGVARKLASSGYAVFAMDYPGFGLSDGLHGYISSFDRLVDDVIEHYSKIRGEPKYRDLPCFLYGQSLGGAVALKIHLKQPNAWNGAVLMAPMCKIADNVVPSWPVVQILLVVACLFPKKKWVPFSDLADLAFKDCKKKDMTTFNVIAYHDPPRLRTAAEMLKATMEIERQMKNVSLPLFILHGAADVVTDPSVSKALYEKAASVDKELKIYDNAYHAILEGESDEVILSALDNIVCWLDAHSGQGQHVKYKVGEQQRESDCKQ